VASSALLGLSLITPLLTITFTQAQIDQMFTAVNPNMYYKAASIKA
jgi:hypothetical protein